MLFSMKACGLPRYSETSIWSSDTPERCVRPAMRDSVSPGRTRYSSGLDGSGWAGVSAVAVAVPFDGPGRRSAGLGDAAGPVVGAGAGVTAATGGGAGEGSGVITGAVDGPGTGDVARLRVGGSNSSVYSRTRRPVDHEPSRITPTKGSCTERSLVRRR